MYVALASSLAISLGRSSDRQIQVGGFPVIFMIEDGELVWIEDDRLASTAPHLRTLYDTQIEEAAGRLTRTLRMQGMIKPG